MAKEEDTTREDEDAFEEDAVESDRAPEDDEPEAASSDEQSASEDQDDDGTPVHLGATKYVHAAFFAAGILVAYLSGQILASIWNTLAEWPEAVRAVPGLLRYAEDERPTFTMLVGAVLAVVAVLWAYRKEEVKQWADEVAIELSKVTWPDKELVTNGTVVVCIAGVIATVYIALLDKFWGFVTTLVYGV